MLADALHDRITPASGRLLSSHPIKKSNPCDLHMDGPSGYVEWHDWAERMERTHEQRQCSGCGLWKIWVRRKKVQLGDRT